jgi:CRAL/TRIO domain
MEENDKADEEGSLHELLNLHRAQIGALLDRFKGEDAGGTCIVDELFMLRFVLSDPLNAEFNVSRALEWRRTHREELLRARAGDLLYDKELLRHVKRGFCGWLGEQYLVLVVRAGHGNGTAIMRDLTMQQCVQNMLFHHEQMFAVVDEKSRRTNRLCKMFIVIDLQGFSMRRFDRRFAKANGESTHIQALYYPQLIKSIVIINLPATFRILYSFGKMFQSRTSLEKQKICPARTLSRSASECPFLARFGPSGAGAVPPFLVGTFPIPAGLQLEDVEMDEN